MEQVLLADEDFIRIFTEEQKKQGVPDRYNFPEAIAGNAHYHRVLAQAQLKNVMVKAPWKITTIGEERSVPNRTQIRFLLEDEYQALLKEAGL